MVAEHLRPQPRSVELSLSMHGCFAASPNSKRVKDNRAGRTEKMQMQATQRSKVYASKLLPLLSALRNPLQTTLP